MCFKFLFQLVKYMQVYVTVSAKTRLVCTIKIKILFTQQYQQFPRNGPPKFEPSAVCSFEIIAIDSRKSNVIDLYNDCTENKLQMLTLAAITSVWISIQCCNVALNIHHGPAHQSRYSIIPVVT